MSKLIALLLFSTNLLVGCAQSQKVEFIQYNFDLKKDFGAIGNGIVNDHEAFLRAAKKINELGANVKLVIPKGVYLVGKQTKIDPINGLYLLGVDCISLVNCNNIEIIGEEAEIVYKSQMKYGAFNVETGKALQKQTMDVKALASIGNFMILKDCKNIHVGNLKINGNSDAHILGGGYGDVGWQVRQAGFEISNCTNVLLDNLLIKKMALDAIIVGNTVDKNKIVDQKIVLNNIVCDSNGRQGLSWIGGSGLSVTNCTFSNTGKGAISSAPGAGVDIEAELGLCTNATFKNCKFIDNTGCGLVSDQGNSKNLTFTGCTFVGIRNWSVWVTKENVTFKACVFNGGVVHGNYKALNREQAIKYYDCIFTDKPYEGKKVFGKFLAEWNGLPYQYLENCTFDGGRSAYLIWYQSKCENSEAEKPTFKNCNFFTQQNFFPNTKSELFLLTGVKLVNCDFKNLLTKQALRPENKLINCSTEIKN